MYKLHYFLKQTLVSVIYNIEKIITKNYFSVTKLFNFLRIKQRLKIFIVQGRTRILKIDHTIVKFLCWVSVRHPYH